MPSLNPTACRLVRRLVRIRIRPFQWLHKWTKNHRNWFAREDIVTATRHGFQIGASPSDWVSWRIFFEGEYDVAMSRFWNLVLRPGDVVLDVGAQRGWFSLLSSVLVGKTGQVHAFEASPSIHLKLCKNLQLNQVHNVTANQLAIWSSPGEIGFQEANAIEAAGDRSLSNNSGLGRVSTGSDTTKVTADTIDRYVEAHRLTQVRLIKLDIEGAEYMALQGAARTLLDLRPIIALELARAPAFAEGTAGNTCTLLKEARYNLYTYDGSRAKPFDLTGFLNQAKQDTLNVFALPLERDIWA